MHQPYDKPQQSKFLPGRRPIIKLARRPILQPPHIVTQPKMIPKVPLKEKMYFSRKISTTYRSNSSST